MFSHIIFASFTYDEMSKQNELIQLPVNSNIKILYVGDYKKGELDIKILNREWWGLFVKDNVSLIKKVKLNLEKIEPDIQYDWQYELSRRRQ